MFAEDISEDFSEDRRYHLKLVDFKSISGYLRNLRGRLLSSQEFSEVLALSVFTLPVLLFLGLFENTKENLKNTKDFLTLRTLKNLGK